MDRESLWKECFERYKNIKPFDRKSDSEMKKYYSYKNTNRKKLMQSYFNEKARNNKLYILVKPKCILPEGVR